MSRKGVVALGMLAGVAIVAGMLRIKFYFDPPEDRFTNRSNELISAVTDPEIIVADPVAVDTVAVTPQLAATVQYNLTKQDDLGDGILLDVLATTDRLVTIQLQGGELVTQGYDLDWQPLADSRHVLQTNVQLIAGLPPQVQLAQTATGYSLVQSVAQSETVYDIVLHSYANDWSEQSTTVLQDDLAVLEDVTIRLADNSIWLLVSGEDLIQYTLQGALLATQAIVIAATSVCDVIPDQSDVVVVLESSTTMTLQKQTQFGEVKQAVSFPRPNNLVGCLAVLRQNEQLVVQLPDSLVPYADNLSEQYEPVAIQSNQFFPQVTLGEAKLWLAYSTSSTLGQYAMHVTTYVASVTPPDVTTEYTN